MKILLIRPPYSSFDDMSPVRIGLPLGAMYIAAMLEKKCHEVKIFDSLVYNDFVGKNHIGASWKRIKQEITDFSPDVIGITNQFSQQIANVIEIAKLVKEMNRGIKIVVGGPHASVRPDDFIDTGYFDIVVMGEGEYTMLDILDYFQKKKPLSKINGIVYKKGEKTFRKPPKLIEKLDELPLPAYHLVDMKRYFMISKTGLGTRPPDPFSEPRNEISMITSRGCPFNCVFCSIHECMGRSWRSHSAEYVAQHMNFVIEKYGVDFIHFEDDNISVDVERFKKIINHIKIAGIEWDTPNGVRADTLNKSVLENIKRTKIKEIRIAIESGNQEVLNKIIGKNLDLGKVLNVVKDARKIGIPLSAFYVVGLPGETKENIQETLDLSYRLMRDYDVMPHINVANPIFGTRLYEICKDNKFLVNDDYTKGDLFGYGRIKTNEFSPEYIRKIVTSFYRTITLMYVFNIIKSPLKLINVFRAVIFSPMRMISTIKASAGFLKK